MDMKILLLDIETAPNTAYVWGIFKENIPIARLRDSSYVMCFAAKWLGEKKVIFSSVHHDTPEDMLKKIHSMLDEADAVVHYNGTKFDIPTLNKEFLLYGMSPPAPYKQIDLLNTVRNQFKFVSNKLDYVSQQLGLGQKHDTTFELWVKCMEGVKAAWKKMEAYNKQDVLLLEKLYARLLPWIKNHPNVGLYKEENLVCPVCGKSDYQSRGWYYGTTTRYQRYQCKCGKWMRGTKNYAPKGEKLVSCH